MTRAAIYCRVSTPGQEEQGSSLDTQEQACREYAAEHGYELIAEDVYRETFTGAELWDRPRLTALREAIKHRDVDVVIAHAIDRLSRDPIHMGVIISEADHAGVAVEFVTEPMDNSPEGHLIRYVRGYAAQMEREKIRERNIRGKLARVRSGKIHGHSSELYGYRRDKTAGTRAVYEPEAAVVRDIFAWCVRDSASLRSLAERLNDAGIPSPSAGKRQRANPEPPRWGKSQVRRILTDPAYKGDTIEWRMKSNGPRKATSFRPESEWIHLPEGTTPPIVNSETWGAAQQRLLTNTGAAQRNATRQYLLRGMIRCAECGRPMWSAPEKPDVRVYRCSSRDAVMGPCGGKRVRADDIEAWAWHEVEKILRKPATIAKELQRRKTQGPDPQVERDRLTAQRALARLEQQQEKLVRSFAESDDVTADLLRKEISRLEQEKARYRESVISLERDLRASQAELAELDALQAYCSRVAANLEQFGFDEKRLALDALQIKIEASGLDWRMEGSALVPAGVTTPPYSRSDRNAVGGFQYRRISFHRRRTVESADTREAIA